MRELRIVLFGRFGGKRNGGFSCSEIRGRSALRRPLKLHCGPTLFLLVVAKVIEVDFEARGAPALKQEVPSLVSEAAPRGDRASTSGNACQLLMREL